MRPDPGAGYRLLTHGEEREVGDETLRYGGKEWLPVTELGVHSTRCDPAINDGDPHWPTRRRVPQNHAEETCRVCSEAGNFLPDLGIALCSKTECWEAFRREYNGEGHTQQNNDVSEPGRRE